MERPRHLIHVGFPKAGSTFFKAWCQSHGDVAFHPEGIAGYARVENIADQGGGPPALRVTSSERLASGNGPEWMAELLGRGLARSPGGLGAERESRLDIVGRQERVCQALWELFPEAEILFLVRGYRTALRSWYAQEVKGGRESALSEALLQASLEWLRAYFEYDRVVGLYEEAFGADRVTVLPYELLHDDVGAFVRALCRIGGVPYRPFDPGRVNAAPPPHALGVIQRVTPAVHAVASRVPKARRLAVLSGYRRTLRRVYPRPGLDALGRALGVTPFPDRLYTDAQLREAFAGCANEVARRPEVAPYAASYTFEAPSPIEHAR